MIRARPLGPEAALRREWVEPDGLGGFAFGTPCLRPSRRYHALLTVARHPPVDRRVLLSGFEEHVAAGDEAWRIDSSDRISGAVSGHQFLVGAGVDPFPRARYQLGDHLLDRVVLVPRGHPRVVVEYHHVEGPRPLELDLVPLIAGRFFHDLLLENSLADPSVLERDGELLVRPYEDEPELWIGAEELDFHPDPRWVPGFLYLREEQRGYPHREDLLAPGRLHLRLVPGQVVRVTAGAGPLGDLELADLVSTERARREALLAGHDDPGDAAALLTLAADRFRLVPESSHPGVMAGYPWFEDWGRDTFISLPGLEPGAPEDFVPAVLEAFSGLQRWGLIPNRLGDRPEEAEYNAADATLWFLLECGRRCLREVLPDHLWPAMRAAFTAYLEGTRHGISVDPLDGLVRAGEEGLQLTWMDALVDDQVVTPRSGKPVELQGLWMNACVVVRAEALRREDEEIATRASDALERARASFQDAYWIESRGYLADCITPGGIQDSSLRPNQLIALALPFCPLEPGKARRALEVVERELVTPYGVRTLEPGDGRYRGTYGGDVVARDHAYHQGTAWPWLLGPYGRACLRLRDGPGERHRLRQLLEPLLRFLMEDGWGNLPEVFDGDAPHTPGGCPAQAWSVAEVRRLLATVELQDPYDPTEV